MKRSGLKRLSWLTLRRTYSSWAHEKGVPGKVIAQLMGHARSNPFDSHSRERRLGYSLSAADAFFVERELAADVAVRTGVVVNARRDPVRHVQRQPAVER